MHDPLVVAFDIKLPIPRLTSWGRVPPGHKRFTIQRRRYTPVEENMQHFMGVPIYPAWRPCAWYVWVGQKQLKMRTFCTVWHREPGGHDSGEICSHWKVDKATGKKIKDENGFIIDNSWKWHVRHWHLQFPWLQSIRTHFFQKCAWCGGPSRKGNWVNNTYQWNSDDKLPFWKSRPHLYHGDCMTPEHAWRSCSCEFPALPVQRNPRTGEIYGVRDYGKCETCDRFHGWGSTPEQKAVYEFIRSTTPPNTPMSPATKAEVHRRWEEIRALKGAD